MFKKKKKSRFVLVLAGIVFMVLFASRLLFQFLIFSCSLEVRRGFCPFLSMPMYELKLFFRSTASLISKGNCAVSPSEGGRGCIGPQVLQSEEAGWCCGPFSAPCEVLGTGLAEGTSLLEK